MYYWSRWSNISTTETRTDEAQEKQASWRDTAPRLAAQRETRPVVVVTRSRTQPLPASSSYQRARFQERDTSEGISLDVRRSTYAARSSTRALTPAGQQHEATTQPVLAAFRLK
jgi:hypothetical protein